MLYQNFISPETKFYRLRKPFQLETGEVLPEVEIAYRSWGKLTANGEKVVLVCHALTGSADADEWWEPLFGPGKTLDPGRDFIICSNVLGSCYGTTGPTSINPQEGKSYGPDFPAINVRDMVRLQYELLRHLGVEKLSLVIGGSLGGMQVLEWGKLYPDMVGAIASIAASGRHSAWCIGLSECQRQAIYADPHWQGGYYTAENVPTVGLATARAIAMHTYRSQASFEQRFSRRQEVNGDFAIASYLRYQGKKLVERFDANTYVTLTEAMDRHDVAAGEENYFQVLATIGQPTLVVAIDTDILYPPVEQQELAQHMPNVQLAWLSSPHGHDAFLIEMAALNEIVVKFLQQI